MSRKDTTNCALQWQANGRIEARHRVINKFKIIAALAEHVVQPPNGAASRWLRVESEKPPLRPDSERDVCPGLPPRKILPRAVAGAAAIAAQRATGAIYIFRSAAHGAPRLGIINAPPEVMRAATIRRPGIGRRPCTACAMHSVISARHGKSAHGAPPGMRAGTHPTLARTAIPPRKSAPLGQDRQGQPRSRAISSPCPPPHAARAPGRSGVDGRGQRSRPSAAGKPAAGRPV